MYLKINGKEEQVDGEISVDELIRTRGVDSPEMVSVELNGDILEQNDFKTIRLQENDEVEFLYFMGGGRR